MDYDKNNRGPDPGGFREGPGEAAFEQIRESEMGCVPGLPAAALVSVAGAEGWRG